ncbi:hypothetical protein [Brevibacillus sp. NRS-1366]|uniref:hypothetical protein n=1 Tax=Brevibacillus sp. NRS-1366 TaxID=3233899 RepID=UPI003D1BCEB2
MERNESFTDFFVLLAQDFLKEESFPSMVCAYAGGSVGRGEADAHSDLDLNIIVEGKSDHTSENREFRGQIIQLHIHPAPINETVYERPWSWRYIKEARLIYDPQGRYSTWFHFMRDYLDSEEGRGKMLEQAKRDIDQYHDTASLALAEGFDYSAYLAAWAGWTCAVQMYAYFCKGTAADGWLFPLMKETGQWEVIERLLLESYGAKQDVQDRMGLIAAYRAYLRSQRDRDMFALDPLNDILLRRKLERLRRQKEEGAAKFLLFSEAIWLYLCEDADQWLENHWESLPRGLLLRLKELGFLQADEELINRLRIHSDEIIATIC